MEQVCKNCKYFRQHFIRFGRSYRDIAYRHCVFQRLKERETNEKACEHYKKRD